MVILIRVFALRFLFAFDTEHIVSQRDIDRVFGDSRQLCRNHQLVIAFRNVNPRRKAAERQPFASRHFLEWEAARKTIKNAADFLLQAVKTILARC